MLMERGKLCNTTKTIHLLMMFVVILLLVRKFNLNFFQIMGILLHRASTADGICNKQMGNYKLILLSLRCIIKFKHSKIGVSTDTGLWFLGKRNVQGPDYILLCFQVSILKIYQNYCSFNSAFSKTVNQLVTKGR